MEYRSPLEIRALIDDANEDIKHYEEQYQSLRPSGLTYIDGQACFMCSDREEAWLIGDCLNQATERRDELLWELIEAENIEYEAKQRGCTVEELIAVKEGHATYIPNYDDHTSDDPRCEQNILCELGMHIETNPIPLNKIDRGWVPA